jgi:hypothetical protein
MDPWQGTLAASGPHPSLGEHADTYGRVIGHWRGELTNYMAGTPQHGSIAVSFAWVLEGRAVQDTWLTASAGLHWCGTTLRVFDAQRASWRALWWDPITTLRIELEGRRIGDDIVQLGTRDGRPIRWVFSDIAADAFAWSAHILEPDAQTWRREVAIALRRA